MKYDEAYWRYIRKLNDSNATKTILQWLAPAQGDRILDLGCGTGRLTALVEDKGATVVGLEVDEDAVRVARSRVSSDLVRGSAEYLPFREGLFDKVLFCHAVEHLDNPLSAIRQVHEVLTGKGVLVLSYPNAYYLPYLLRLLKQDPAHRQAFSSFQDWLYFDKVKKRVFLSLWSTNDRLTEFFRLSSFPLLRELFYNVILLMVKRETSNWRAL